MSEVVFSTVTSFSTVELVSSSVEVEEYCVVAGVSNSLQRIVQAIKNREFSSGFKRIYVYDASGDESELAAVGYIEDWRPMCFPSDVVDSDEKREAHIESVREERVTALADETAFDSSWSVVLDRRDMLAGGGEYGQSQFFAVHPEYEW